MNLEKRAILFFDGECGLCNRSVQLLMHLDQNERLYYAPLQGETAQRTLSPRQRESLSSVIYQKQNGTIHDRSTAVLQAIHDTQSFWKILAVVALWIPTKWRDSIYMWIAARRKRWFNNNQCGLPNVQAYERILP